MESTVNYNTIMTNYGYLIKKTDITSDVLEVIKEELTVKPQLNNKYK